MTLSLNVVGVAQYITIHSLKPQFYETETECASGNRALNFKGKFPGNFLETVRVVIGQESVRVGMWSRIYNLAW